MTDLFEASGFESNAPRPLADRLRPRELAEVVGQDHLLGPEGAIGRMAAVGRISSMVLWGPPGTGKTTVAGLLASRTGLHFTQISAVFSGVADLRRVFDKARIMRRDGQGTVLFVDEIHRFNRAQQDGFLPYVEDGTVILIGATTENPSFELNPPLLSRAQVLVFQRLPDEALESLLTRAEAAAGRALPVTEESRAALRAMADGDGRYILNLVERLLALPPESPLGPRELAQLLHRRAPLYDKLGDGHYNLISALHKAVRGSDPDAALYWLARMLDGGEEPLYLARRVVRMAVEDVGLADPRAIVQVLAAKDAYDFLGSPEGELALAQAVLYVATAPKSNAVYAAFGKARAAAKDTGSLAPPAHALNAPTRLMKDAGYGRGYRYDHDMPEAFAGDTYFPEGMPRADYYAPTSRGFEAEIAVRMARWRRLRDERG